MLRRQSSWNLISTKEKRSKRNIETTFWGGGDKCKPYFLTVVFFLKSLKKTSKRSFKSYECILPKLYFLRYNSNTLIIQKIGFWSRWKVSHNKNNKDALIPNNVWAIRYGRLCNSLFDEKMQNHTTLISERELIFVSKTLSKFKPYFLHLVPIFIWYYVRRKKIQNDQNKVFWTIYPGVKS
jgi:hypothetical protein